MDIGTKLKSQQTGEILLNSKDHLRDALINRILLVSAIFAVIALVSAMIRAFNIGWYYHDMFQLVILCSIVILTLFRQKLIGQYKTLFLIVLLSIAGFSGVYTLGMLGGTVFLFPLVVVIIAIFYSMRTTIIYILIFLLLFGLVAVKFCSILGKETFYANFLMSNYLHWIVYILFMVFFFAVACVSIHTYRRTMKELLHKINCQHDDLIQTNQKLLSATKNIKKLSGLLPICSYCKKIRNDKGYWEQLEIYIAEHSEADFSHSICDGCLKTKFKDGDIP
jgi:hypothetical protein